MTPIITPAVDVLAVEGAPSLQQAIELVAGVLLLAAGYMALLSRRAEDPEDRKSYRRAVLRTVTGFLMFAYAAAVLVPESTAWPVEFGESIRSYFQQLDTVPATVNDELTAFYTAITEKVGVVTEPTSEKPVTEEPVANLLKPIRTVGLVAYTLFFSAASLGLQVPRRIVKGLRGSEESGE